MQAKTLDTGESILLRQEQGLGKRQPPRLWNSKLGYMQAQPMPPLIEQAQRPARAPRVYNRPGPTFQIFDRRTGCKLWRLSGSIDHVLQQLMKQLNHLKMPISAIRFHKVTAVTSQRV